MSYLDVIEEFERERSHRVFTWKDFHPELDPVDWEIKEDESGGGADPCRATNDENQKARKKHANRFSENHRASGVVRFATIASVFHTIKHGLAN